MWEEIDPRWLTRTLDVLVVAYLLYRTLLVIRGTRAAPMLWGLVVVVVLFFVAKYLDLVTLGFILGNFLSSIILVIVVLFQDEIRRGLTKVGLHGFFTKSDKPLYDKTIEDLTLVVQKLSRDRVGALIVVQGDIGLDEFVEDAVTLDALMNRKLLYSLFVKDSPLHDGAVLVEGDRIKAAGCVLPLSFNPDLDPNLGTRHRAALGLSERCDSIVIIVSEENGSISVAREGRITRNLDASMLRDYLKRFSTARGVTEEVEASDAE